jgi:hypothetical protein
MQNSVKNWQNLYVTSNFYHFIRRHPLSTYALIEKGEGRAKAYKSVCNYRGGVSKKKSTYFSIFFLGIKILKTRVFVNINDLKVRNFDLN